MTNTEYTDPILAAPDVLILGAGPAGLLCALTAAGRGRKVVVVEGADTAARKLRASGGGRSNCTNTHLAPESYLSADPRFTARALARFSSSDFQTLISQWGLSAHEEEQGRMFLRSGSHSPGRGAGNRLPQVRCAQY